MKAVASIALMLALAFGADAQFALAHSNSRGGRGGAPAVGSHHGAGHAISPSRPPTAFNGPPPTAFRGPPPTAFPGHRPGMVPSPPVVVTPPSHHFHPMWIGSTLVLAAPLLYYYPPYMPGYAEPIYSEPPVYVDQSPSVSYYCPTYNDYYPNVATCPVPWLAVLPYSGGYPN